MILMLGVLATPALWATCVASINASKPDTIYTDNGNGTITDNQTHLMWIQCSEGLSSGVSPCDSGTMMYFTWEEALVYVETFNSGGGFAGHTDWRLPNVNELASLIERRCYNAAVNETFFANTGSGTADYWSASPATNGTYAWSVDLAYGQIEKSLKTNSLNVRLVRDAQ